MHTNLESPEAHEWILPLDDAPDSTYTTVRDALRDAGFTETTLCERFGLASITEFRSRREGRAEQTRRHDAFEVLTDLFMDLAAVDEHRARKLLGDAAVTAMCDLRLLYTNAGPEPHLLSSMLLYPTAGVWLASDRTFARPGEQLALPADIVYPAITRTTSMFVRMLPPSPCGTFLEMCAGNGIAAIAMAARAGHSWSLDITARACHVARFNARLNGLTNVTVAEGDLYAPVEGRTFDRIVAHPPYVPSANQQIVYRDGGPDGEFITRRLVSELPPFLNPGGRFCATCIVTDRTDAPFERRVREWLGADANHFDVVVAVTSAEHPSEYYFKSAINGERTFADAEAQHTVLKALQVERLVYCSFVIERHAEARTPATVRLSRGTRTTGRELEQYCDWLSRRESADVFARMLVSYPCLDRSAVLHHVQRLRDEKWKPGTLEIETSWPFVATLQCPEDVAQLLARCDGTRTLKQLITAMRQKGFLKTSVPDQAITQLIGTCVASGVLHLEDPEHRTATDGALA